MENIYVGDMVSLKGFPKTKFVVVSASSNQTVITIVTVNDAGIASTVTAPAAVLVYHAEDQGQDIASVDF